MIETAQTVMHDPENGQIGNCFSAVLASLLHLPLDAVPLFVSDDWRVRLNAWLRPYGLAYLSVLDFERHCQAFGIEGCYHEIAAESPRSPDSAGEAFDHAVVGRDGAVIFDPHPSGAGLRGPMESGVFIALEPWRLVGRGGAA